MMLDEVRAAISDTISGMGCRAVPYAVERARPGFGDITSNVAFALAKTLRRPPAQIADEVASKIKPHSMIDSVRAVSGHLNFYLSVPRLAEKILGPDSPVTQTGKRITIEHTSVNPNKALHIGHVRNVVIGDTISRILERAGNKTTVLNYVDDSGLQVADIVLGFRVLGYRTESEKRFDRYCGDVVYVETTAKYEQDPKLREMRGKILKQIEGGGETAEFAKTITKRVLREQMRTCWRLGATYDRLNYESQIIRSGMWDAVFERLKQSGAVYLEESGKNAGCWMIPRQNKNDRDDKVLVRSNGTATYIAKDIPYAAWKVGIVEDPFLYVGYDGQGQARALVESSLDAGKRLPNGADMVITVIDSRQSGLQRTISHLLAVLGELDPSQYVHLAYESVSLSPDTARSLGADTGGKATQMSGRRGLYVNADDVLDMLAGRVAKETAKRNTGMPDERIKKIAEATAVATLRYEMIKQDLDKPITFDLARSLSLEGDTAPYVLYSYARAMRILERARAAGDPKYEKLTGPYERDLLVRMALIGSAVADAANNLAPKVISKYCYELAVSFNSFYEHVRVLDADPDTVGARLRVVDGFCRIMRDGLGMLGIEPPSRM